LDAGDAGGEEFHAELGERVRGGKGEDVVFDGGQVGGRANRGDEFGEAMGADDGVARGGDEGVEFFVGKRDATDGVVIGERLLDAPGIEDGDDDVALVFCERFAEADLGVLEAAVDADYALYGRGEAWVKASSKDELTVIINTVPSQSAEGAVDALHELPVLLALRMLHGSGG